MVNLSAVVVLLLVTPGILHLVASALVAVAVSTLLVMHVTDTVSAVTMHMYEHAVKALHTMRTYHKLRLQQWA